MIPDRPQIAARIAWTYLDCLLALVVSGLIALIAHPIVASTSCRFDDLEASLTCELGWIVVVVVLAFLLAFGAFVRLLRLDVWAWLALIAGMVGLMMVGRITEWWWWVALPFVPAVAAVVSAPWVRSGRGRLIHHLVIAAAAAAAVVGAVIWYGFVSG